MAKTVTVSIWVAGLCIFAYECGIPATIGIAMVVIADAVYSRL